MPTGRKVSTLSTYRASKPHLGPIGVFDSGLGGLTVVREIRRQLPGESIVYFGDLARLPYGTKSPDQIRRFSKENTEFLLTKGIKALVIACNSSSSAAFHFLKRNFKIPVLSVIEPAVQEALAETRSRRIGVIGTSATIESRVYEEALRKQSPGVRVYPQSCPFFVPLVEEGWLGGRVTLEVVKHYLKPLKKHKIDTLILGCTHYPLLKMSIQQYLGPKVRLVDSAVPTVEELASLLNRRSLQATGKAKGRFHICTSDSPRNFRKVGELFLGEKLPEIQVVRR